MSQPLSNLAEGTLVNIIETINGAQFTVPMLIIANNINNTNPYGSDVTFCIRRRTTGHIGTEKAQDGANFKYSSTATDVNYDGSDLDTFITGEWLGRIDDKTKARISTSDVICYNPENDSPYTIQRKAFALSNKEYGGTYTTDTSTNPGYFTNNASRVGYESQGREWNGCWTRSPADSQNVCFIYVGGNVSGSIRSEAPTSTNCKVRPACNFYSNTLVSDEPNYDGSYNILCDTEAPYKTLNFDCLLLDSDYRPSQVKADFGYVCSGENASVSIQLCNNYYDDEPAWENAEIGMTHPFANNTKTAGKWAVGFKAVLHGESTIYAYEPAAVILLEE